MFRYRQAQLDSLHGHKPVKCPFCHLDDKELNPKPRRILKETDHALILDALYPYDFWEFRDVTEHLMVIPKRHVGSLSELTAAERHDLMDIFCEYEAQGYNVYARPINSVQRSIPLHQHTHFIKTGSQQARGALYLAKPYFVQKF